MRMFRDAAMNPMAAEYLFSCDDDAQLADYWCTEMMGKFHGISIINGASIGSAPAWDRAARACRGDLLIQCQDDIEPPMHWDAALLDKIMAHVGPDWRDKPFVVAVSDGYRKDRLLCTAICNRARYVQQGEFLHAGYQSVFSDDEFSIRSYGDAADGKCTVVDARDIIFRHRHYAHDPAVKYDETYARENSSEAYALGSKLFFARNQQLVDRGFRDWK